MIKILHLITDLDIGGAEMMLLKLLSRINKSLFSNIVVSMTENGALEHRIKELGVPVYTLGMQRGFPNPAGIWRLIKLLKDIRPHILQTWLYHADLLGILAGKIAHVPSIVWNVRCSYMDMTQYKKLSSAVSRVLTKLSSLPDAVIANSGAGKSFHEQSGYNVKHWEIIPNGFDLDTFHPDPEARVRLRNELGIAHDSLLIGLIARYDPMKDHENFLQAAGILIHKNPSGKNRYFLLAGRGADENNYALVRRIEALQIKKYVFLMGERNDIPALTAALDIATSSSYGESFPNVIGEAMACEVPCVATDVGDSAWIIGDAGRVVPPGNPQALADALKALADLSHEQRQELGKLARQRIANNFSLDSIVHKYEDFYQGIIQNKIF